MTELLEIPFRFENEQIILFLAVSKTHRLFALLRKPFQTLHDRRYGGKSSSRHRR